MYNSNDFDKKNGEKYLYLFISLYLYYMKLYPLTCAWLSRNEEGLWFHHRNYKIK